MFKPLKILLTYLQKNTTIFENTSNMNSNKESKLLAEDTKTSTKSDFIPNKNSTNKIADFPPPILTGEFNTDDNDECEDKEDKLDSTRNYFENCNVISIELDDNSDSDLQREEFPAGELLLLNENLSNSFPLDPITDPLAIEEDFQNDIENNVNLPKPSSVSDIVSTDGDILYIIDIDDIKEQGIKIDELNNSLSTNTTLQNCGVSVEEQELRSDGSDSGLGSETSVLQPNANSSSSIQLELPIKVSTPSYSNLKRRSENDTTQFEKRPKRSINFEGVKIYYFPRIQGFACVPSQGGCTLGMGARHIHLKTFTLAEHAAEQRRTHKLQMQEINPRGSSSDESDSDDELSEGSSSDLDADANGFLQPVPAKQRRALLKAAGVRKIDPLEKDECRAIRSSREFCGCNCRGYCDPDSCSCSQAGIKCQVDRPSFPCGCTRDGCANITGRVEFNPGRVRTHFIHTIMRLDLENKQTKTDDIHARSLQNSNSILYSNNNCETNKICETIYSNSDNNARAQSFDQVPSYNQNYININNNHSEVVTSSSASCFFDHQPQSNIDTRINNDIPDRNFSHQQNLYGFQINANDNTHMLDYATGNNQLQYYSDRTSPYFMSNGYQNYSNYQANYNQNYLNIPQNNSAELNEIDKNIKKDNELTANKYISLNSISGNTTQIDAINDLLHNNRNTPPVKSIKNARIVPITISHTASSCTLAPSGNTHISTSITEGTSTSISTYTTTEIKGVDFSANTSETIKTDDRKKKSNNDEQSQIWIKETSKEPIIVPESTVTNHLNQNNNGCDIVRKITSFFNESSSIPSNELHFSLKNGSKEKRQSNEENNSNYYDNN